MKKSVQRIVVLVLVAFLMVSMIFPALSVMAGAVTQSEIDNIKNELNDIVSQKEAMEEKLESIQNDMEEAETQVELIRDQIVLTEQQIVQSQQLLDEYDQQIGEKEAEIAQLEEEEAAQYQEFCEQTRWLEENGGVSILSILFQVSSFSELADRMMLVNDIMEYNNRIIEQLEVTQQEISEAREQLQEEREEQAQAQQELESAKSELETRKAEADVLYQQIAAQESEISEEAKKLAASEAEIEAELEKAEKEYESQLNDLVNNGGGAAQGSSGDWYWPLPGWYYISSVFGGRYSPITGRWETHTGTDIPATGGTPIYAAQSGYATTVRSESFGSSYGNYCIISHGNGYATLYAHMLYTPCLTQGQYVEKGQVIGYVGTSGSSTGNHLHFELRINGNRANVLSLYPNMSFSGL